MQAPPDHSKKTSSNPAGIKGRHDVVPPFFMVVSQLPSRSVHCTEAITWQTANTQLVSGCVVIGS